MTNTPQCALAGCPAGKRAIIGLTTYFVFLFVLLTGFFILTWAILQDALHAAMLAKGLDPAKVALTPLSNIVETIGTKNPFAATPMTVNGKTLLVVPDSLAVLAVMSSGAFGGLIHSIRSMYFHVIEGDFGQADVIKLILRPFSGAILALIFYLVLRAGLGDGTEKADGGASVMFYTAIGAIVGMFTDQTVTKLKKVAEAILTKPEAKQEQKEGDNANT